MTCMIIKCVPSFPVPFFLGNNLLSSLNAVDYVVQTTIPSSLFWNFLNCKIIVSILIFLVWVMHLVSSSSKLFLPHTGCGKNLYFFLLSIAFYAFFSPFLGKDIYEYIALGVYSFLALSVFILDVRCMGIDPADLGILIEDISVHITCWDRDDWMKLRPMLEQTELRNTGQLIFFMSS